MPRRADLHSILIIGSGPIVIGQACEFDYSGTQGAKALTQEGYRVILVNSNPATIMTDPDFADATYIEPLDVDVFTPVPGKVPMTPNKLALSPTPVEPMPKLADELGLTPKPVVDKADKGKPAKPDKPMRTIPPDPRTARPPQPTSKEGGSAWIIVLALLLLGGGVVAFLVFGM